MADSKGKSNEKTSLSDEEVAKKAQELQERFEHSKNEFMSKKLSDVPCLRSTFLTSIPSGLVASLVSYLVTSKPKMSANVGMGTYLAVSAGYFLYCRRDYDQKIAQNKELGDLMNLIIKYRGTDLEKQLQQRYKEKCEEFSR